MRFHALERGRDLALQVRLAMARIAGQRLCTKHAVMRDERGICFMCEAAKVRYETGLTPLMQRIDSRFYQCENTPAEVA